MGAAGTQERIYIYMDLKQHFKEHDGKLRLEALLKSLLSGSTIGGSLGFVVACVTWFTDLKGLWLSIGVILGFTLVTTALFYFKVHKPSLTASAKRLDRLGLDERLITMVEYQNDNSFMAKLQRLDAAAMLSKVAKSDIKLLIPIQAIIMSATCLLLASGMTVVTGLADAGIIMGGQELIESLKPEEPEIKIMVTYEAEEGGSIEGEYEQFIVKGEDAEPVLAVPEDGYVFIEWSDGITDPYRQDLEILEELELFAVFEWDEGAEDDSEGDEGEGEGEGDMEAPSEEQGEKDGEGEKSEESEDGDPSDESEPNDQGKYGEANQIIDGETYYKEIIGEYRDKLIEYLEKNRDRLSEEEIAIIESYIGIV